MRDISSPLDGIASPFGPQRIKTLTQLLFASSEPGFTFEPWDMTTLFQDRAGTTPVTAAGQSVGYRLDKSGRGNHQVAVSDAKRGVYGWMPKTGRRNLLTYTEQFDNAAWTKFRSTVSANAAVAPDATTTAEKLIPNNGTTAGGAYNTTAITIASGSAHTASVYVKAAELGFVFVGANIRGSSTNIGLCVNLSTGARSNEGASGTYTVTDVGDGWWRITCSGTSSTTSGYIEVWPLGAAGSFDSYLGNGTSGILIWGAQLEVGSTATAYQRVVSQYDITEAGVTTCYYVQADGVDDAYVTPTITPNTDKAQVFAGVRKLGNGMHIEYSASADANNGAFYRYAGEVAAGDLSVELRGTQATKLVSAGAAIPVNRVETSLLDIAATTRETEILLRINGASVSGGAFGAADAGTGNFLAYPAYIYARAGTSFPFNGLDFGHAVRFGPNLDAATIARVESLIARNTPEVTL